MTHPTVIVQPTIVQPINCWASFTNMASAGLNKLAAGVSNIWAMVKSAGNAVYSATIPLVVRAGQWIKMNPQSATIGAGLATIAAAVGVYLCCKTTPVVAVPVVPVAPVSTQTYTVPVRV